MYTLLRNREWGRMHVSQSFCWTSLENRIPLAKIISIFEAEFYLSDSVSFSGLNRVPGHGNYGKIVTYIIWLIMWIVSHPLLWVIIQVLQGLMMVKTTKTIIISNDNIYWTAVMCWYFVKGFKCILPYQLHVMGEYYLHCIHEESQHRVITFPRAMWSDRNKIWSQVEFPGLELFGNILCCYWKGKAEDGRKMWWSVFARI